MVPAARRWSSLLLVPVSLALSPLRADASPSCPKVPWCGDDCANVPFEVSHCETTEYGPAQANVILGADALRSPNMLWCPGGEPYALCFFSGPPYPTGNESDNPALPCRLAPPPATFFGPNYQRLVAACTCEAFTKTPYYVDINSILNLGAWYETRETCGDDGACCKNIRDCDDKGQGSSCPSTVAPVCAYIANQSKGNPQNSFYPKGDLVSTFSFAMSPQHAQDPPYSLGSTSCNGNYAGCMTAPCRRTDGSQGPLADGTPVECFCPLFYGPFQIGQKVDASTCDLGWSGGLPYFWSAATAFATSDPQQCVKPKAAEPSGAH